VQTQEHYVLGWSVQLDALIVFPLKFDFTKLSDRVFPLLSRFVIFEYKSQGDPLSVARYYQYCLTELGLITTRLMTYRRQDRGEWQSLTQKGARAQWEKLKAQGAKHSSCVVILSTGDPRELRKTVGFEAVTEYEHLKGALYRKVILEDDFIGSVAIYLVVLNELPVCALNASLLVLSTKKKKIEFCKSLLKDIPGITTDTKRFYLFYLLQHHLIFDKEVEIEIMYDMFGPPDNSWIFNYFNERPQKEREQFLKEVYENMLDAHSPQEVALKALGANTPQEAARELIKTKEQGRKFMAYLQQMGI
jgi:hypothetical protein